VTDNKFKTDEECLDAIKKVVGKFGHKTTAGFDRITPGEPGRKPEEIYDIMPEDPLKPYDMLNIIECLTDRNEFEEYKPDYGKTIICGLGRIDGWAVGIVANQRKIVKAKKPMGSGEMQMGGVIYSDSADKAARFIMNCNQQRIPLVFLQDVTGFMVGSRSEQGGIIKDGAKMVNAMANSIVPKFTFIVGNSYGAGNYAMCGKAYDPRLIYAWPSARMAVMSGATAAKTLLQIQESAMKAKGIEIDPQTEEELLKKITDRYNEQLSPYYAAARLWVDGVIDPAETRRIVSVGINAANHAPIEGEYKVGVIQT